MTVYIGADHRGFALKEKLKPWISSLGHDVVDCGNTMHDPVDDFPDFSFAVADRVATSDEGSLGIVICGSGGGVTMAANKVRGIRCALGVGIEDVMHNRKHNDMNVLAISSDATETDHAKDLIKTFLKTSYSSEERFARRLAKITAREC